MKVPGSERLQSVVSASKKMIKGIFEKSVSGPSQKNIPKLRHENGVVGALFASKALVQLIANPLVSEF